MDYSSLKVPQLRSLCRERDITPCKKSGYITKPALIAYLEEFDRVSGTSDKEIDTSDKEVSPLKQTVTWKSRVQSSMIMKPPPQALPLETNLCTLNQVRQELQNIKLVNPSAIFQSKIVYPG